MENREVLWQFGSKRMLEMPLKRPQSNVFPSRWPPEITIPPRIITHPNSKDVTKNNSPQAINLGYTVVTAVKVMAFCASLVGARKLLAYQNCQLRGSVMCMSGTIRRTSRQGDYFARASTEVQSAQRNYFSNRGGATLLLLNTRDREGAVNCSESEARALQSQRSRRKRQPLLKGT